MAYESFIVSISGLTDVLKAAFGAVDDIYYVFRLTIEYTFGRTLDFIFLSGLYVCNSFAHIEDICIFPGISDCNNEKCCWLSRTFIGSFPSNSFPNGDRIHDGENMFGLVSHPVPSNHTFIFLLKTKITV